MGARENIKMAPTHLTFASPTTALCLSPPGHHVPSASICRMTLKRPRGERSDPPTARAIFFEFCAPELRSGPAIDAALSELLRRGREVERRRSWRKKLLRQVDGLEIITRLRLRSDEGRPTGAAWVLFASHFIVPLLLLEVLKQDVHTASQVIAYLL